MTEAVPMIAAIFTEARAEADIPAAHITAYWQLVKATLTDVFDCPDEHAEELINNFRDLLAEGQSEICRIMVYHQEPLEQAAKLAGRNEETLVSRQMETYRQLHAKFFNLAH